MFRRALLLALVAGLFAHAPARAGELRPLPAGIRSSELALPGLDGAEHRLSDLRGSVVLVNFWASWCGPCIRELPGLQQLQQRYADAPFAILAIDVSEDEKRVRHFATQHGMPFPVLLDSDGSEFAAWGSKVLPTTFVIDGTGMVRYVGIADLEWDSEEVRTQLEPLLNEVR